MSILGSILRRFQAHNIPLYGGGPGVAVGRMSRARGKKGGWLRQRYMEAMEPKILLTTLFGGESFVYTDGRGNTITAQLNGNVVAELVAAVQDGVNGSLIFGDIGGQITTGPRKGTIVGNGSLPVTGATNPQGGQFSSAASPPGLTNPNVPQPFNGQRGQQVNLQGVASNSAGQTFAFNSYNVSTTGVVATSPNFGWTIQLFTLSNTTGTSNLFEDLSIPLLSEAATSSTVTAVSIGGAAFNPENNQLVFELHYVETPAATNGTAGGTGMVAPIIFDHLFTLDTSIAGNAPVDLGDLALGSTSTFTALTFVATSPGNALLWYGTEPNANAVVPPAPQAPPLPTLSEFEVDSGGNFDLTAPVRTIPIFEGYGAFGTGRLPIMDSIPGENGVGGLIGLVGLPGSDNGAGSNFLFGVVGTPGTTATSGTAQHVVRINLTPINVVLGQANNSPSTTGLVATAWGDTLDLYQSTAAGNPAPVSPFDGESFEGLTYNPDIINPFTGQLGAVLSIDQHSTDLSFVNTKFRVSQGDVFSVYTNQSDLNASITFRGNSLYVGNPGAFGPGAFPANTGVGYLGYMGSIPGTGNSYLANSPFVSGVLDGSLGILPGLYSTSTTSQPTDQLFAGLVVGHSLEETINPNANLLDQLLGQGFSNVTNMAIANDGTIVVINGQNFGNAGASDLMAFVDPATGAIIRNGGVIEEMPVTLADTTVLRGAQALAYGDPNFTGTQQLYAVYDLGDGNGPTLGTIDTTSGIFTPIGPLGLGQTARVSAIAFSPGGTAINPFQQGLYVIADPNTQDNDSTQTLYQEDPQFGEVINTVGQVVTSSNRALKVVAAAFDGSGRLLVDDQSTGSLLDVDLNTAIAGQHFTSSAGSINPTVGAIAFNPLTQQFLVVDNETGTQGFTASATSSGSAILMQLKDFTQTNADAENLGAFLFDGVVTGRVFVSGSIETFYSGLNLIGDATGGGRIVGGTLVGNFWILPGNGSEGQQITAADEGYFPDNFHADGDIRNVLSLTSMGTSAATGDVQSYSTGLEITAAGKIGNVQANDIFDGIVHAGDQTNIPNIIDGATVSGNSSPQLEIQQFSTSGAQAYSFGGGFVVDAVVTPPGGTGSTYIVPFDNRTLAGAQYLGTIANSVTGQPNVIHVLGELSGGTPTPTPAPGYQNDTVDYYAFSLLAGQTVTVQAQDVTGALGDMGFGIFDPDGRLIATDANQLNLFETQQRPIQFTADRPGVYHVAVTNNDYSFTQGGTPGVVQYSLTVTGSVGDMAIGAVNAGGDIILHGRNSITIPGTGGANPSIKADLGDVGAVVSGGSILAASVQIGTNPNTYATLGMGEFGLQTNNAGYVLSGTPPIGDITTLHGNLRAVVGASIGSSVTQGINSTNNPDFSINGAVGLIQATDPNGILSALLGNAATGNIQVIDAAGTIGGIYRTNKAIGVIRAGNMTAGTANTEFHANVDNIGADGIIDLINVSGTVGTNTYTLTLGGVTYTNVTNGGPSLVTGQGGNVRFMEVGGALGQDDLFSTGGIGTQGEVVHNPGPVGFFDDSGASVTLTPSTINGVVGTLTTRIYAVRGAGGVVIVNVTSSTGLTVSAQAGGTGRAAEIGTIVTQAAGLPLTITNGVPTSPTGAAANTVAITSPDGTRVDVFAINTNGSGSTLNSVSNTTGGDIENITAGNVGSITSNGNLGSMISTTGAVLNPIAVFSNTYPFVDQRFGISVANLGSISSAKSIANVLASGVIGTVTANSDNIDDPNTFEGIDGPIVANGSAAGSGGQLTSITTVNIGEGIEFSGSGSMSNAGIYGTGEIVNVTGTNADIRGNIHSLTAIGTVSLTNGSIIQSNIRVTSSWADDIAYSANAITLPGAALNIDAPNFVLGLVSIAGNGGIIGSYFDGASIGTITVGSSGFGIFSSVFQAVGLGTINIVSAGGYGLRGDVIADAARVGTITATGSGAISQISNYSPNVRFSENFLINPLTGFQVNDLTDLSVWLNGDNEVDVPDPAGTTTGVIEDLNAAGQDSITLVSAYDYVANSAAPNAPSFSIDFGNSTGSIVARHDITGLNIISGGLKNLAVANDVTDVDLKIAGPIGTVTIGGSFIKSIPSATSIISAKGASGTIGNVTISGNDSADLFAQSSIGNVTIGTTGAHGAASTGDFSGNITANGSLLNTAALGLLKIFGAIVGGAVIVRGNAGTINVAHSLTGLVNGLVVKGDLASLIVGSDPADNNAVLGSPLTILGNLTAAAITGKMNGDVTVQGNVGTFTVTSEPGMAPGTDLLVGDLKAGGSISSLTVQGGVAGNVIAGGNITAATIIGGNLDAGAAITSSLGSIGTLSINNGNLGGMVTAPNGGVTTVTVTGTGTGVSATGSISARSLGTINVPGDIAGVISIVNGINTVSVGGNIAPTGNITAGSLASLTTKLDMLGVLVAGVSSATTKLTIGRDLGGYSSFAAPLTATVGRNMLVGSTLSSTNTVTSLAAKGGISGDILVDQGIGTISAATLSDAVITAGITFSTLKITGAMTNSLVQVGVSRGNDGIFGTSDLGETARMGDLSSLTVGSMFNSIVAAGGNIGTFKSTGNATGSSVSSGLVLLGGSPTDSSVGIAAVMADATPLGSTAELNAAREGATLFHGDFKSATVGGTGTTLFGSALTAGVSPGADGAFGTADDNVSSSLTGGSGKFTTLKAVADGASFMLAKSPSKGATTVLYTLDGSANSIVQGDPIVGAPTLTVTTSAPQTITTPDGTITITVKGGTGTTVQVYDDPTTPDRVDTIVINSSSTTAATVTVVTSAPGVLGLGRVLTTANTIVGTFTFNGDILGNGDRFGGTDVGPALWIDSAMTTFSIRNMLDDAAWHGQIGGDVKTLTINQLGSGQFHVGGRITTLNIAGSVGNPLLQQLGNVNPPTSIGQLAINPVDGSQVATNGAQLFGVNTTTGAVAPGVSIVSPLGTPLTLNGLGFNSAGTLYGVTTINSQVPITQLGKITSTGDQLRALAVNSSGQIYAVDSSSGSDTLVTLNPNTGAETVVGVILDSHTNTFTDNVLAMAFDQNDNLLVLVNDQDGNGQLVSPGNGVALAVLTPAALQSTTGTVKLGAPAFDVHGLLTSKVGQPIFIDGGLTDNFTGMAVNSSGQIYVTRNDGGGDELDQLVLNPGSPFIDVALNPIGPIEVDGGATATNAVGMGFDESNNLILLNANGAARELIGVNTTDPTTSVRLTAPALLNNSLSSFALGKTGSTFKAYGYTTDPVHGGTLFTSPGVVPTLGTIATTGPDAGTFTQLLPLAQDATGTGLAGTVESLAIDGSGNVFVVTNAGELAEYSSVDGSLIGGGPLGTIIDSASGNALDIRRIAFDGNGRLVGLDAQENRLVQISTTPTVIEGRNVLLAAGLTDRGSANASDLTALAFSAASNNFLSYSNSSGNFVGILGTSPGTLGGLVANSIGTANIASNFGGRIYTTGNGTSTSLDTLKFTGAGNYTGNITSDGSIGAVTTSGTIFNGTLITHGGIKSIALSGGNVLSNGLISSDGLLSTFTLSGGTFDGTLIANSATSITINSSALSDSLIVGVHTLGSLTITGQAAGIVDLGSVNTFKLTGQLVGSVFVSSDANNITLSGGTAVGSVFLANEGITSLTVGGAIGGVVATRRSVGTATIGAIGVVVGANNVGGVLDIGGSVTNLTVNGAVTNSVISVGTGIGLDGIYNTSDDVIFGGSINSAKIAGVFTNSVIAAGVLPRVGTASTVNNIPTDMRAYSGNPSAANVADVDSAEAGGISASTIQAITFTQPVISSNAPNGIFSLVVTANGIVKSTVTGPLHQVTLSDPAGAPTIAIDPTSLLPLVTLVSPSQIRVVFTEPLDSSTLNSQTVSVTDGQGNPITDVTFGYTTQIAPDGSIEGVLLISSASNFNGAAQINVTPQGGVGIPSVTDRTGPLRSSLFDFNQDGTPDADGDPFGTTFVTRTYIVGGPLNDAFANATPLFGLPVSAFGTNVGATQEPGELTNTGDSGLQSVWWTWTAPATGFVTINTVGSNFDTTLGVYTGSNVAALTQVAGNDDDNTGNLTSSVRFDAIAGTTYHISVNGFFDGDTTATGLITLNIISS